MDWPSGDGKSTTLGYKGWVIETFIIIETTISLFPIFAVHLIGLDSNDAVIVDIIIKRADEARRLLNFTLNDNDLSLFDLNSTIAVLPVA